MATEKRNVIQSVFRWGLLLTVLFIAYTIYAEWRGLSYLHFIGYDYSFFYYAFQVILHHHITWDTLYNIHAQQHFLSRYGFPIRPYNQYVYPPQFACLFSLYGLFPFYLSAGLWMLTSATMYFLGVLWISKMLWPRMRQIHLLALFVVAAFLTPFQMDIGVGNVNSLLFSSMALTFYLLYHRKKAGLAGIPLGLAIMCKVTPAAILLVFLLRKQWRVCRYTGIVVVAGTAVSSLFVGVWPIVQYMLHFSTFGHTSMKNGPAPYNQSIIGVIGMFKMHHWIALSTSMQHLVYVLFSGCALCLLYRAIRRSQSFDWRLDMALASITPVVFSPLIEEPHMVYVLPTLMVFGRMAQEAYAQRTKRARYTCILLSTVAVTSILALSLPTTFVLNVLVAHRPQLFWVQTQMFDVLIAAFGTTLWLYKQSVLPPSSVRRRINLFVGRGS